MAPESPGALLTEWEGRPIEHWRKEWGAGVLLAYATISSTNDVIARLATEGAPSFSVVLAEEQTRGRGRGGSSWTAERGTALLFSLLIRTPHNNTAPGCAPIRAGLAVASAIPGARVKWPNDVVMAGHGKIAGILCEGVFGSHIVVGIGINVLEGREPFPPELHGRASTIEAATGEKPDRAALLTTILRALSDRESRMTAPLTAEELTEYTTIDILHRHEIVCENNGGVVQGTAAGLSVDGALLITTAEDTVKVYNGTVRLADGHAYPGTAERA